MPCQVTSFTLTSPASKSYTIGNPSPTLSWSFTAISVATQIPACGYTLTPTSDISTLPSLLTPSYVTSTTTGSTVTFTCYVQDRFLAQVYNIQVDITLPVSYPYSQPATISKVTQVLNVIDPCISTVINGPTLIQSFVTFAGYQQISNLTYTFNDTVTQLLTLPIDFQDFCGNKTFYFFINQTSTNLLTGNNTLKIKFSPLWNTTVFGDQSAVLSVCMQDYYPNICKNTTFTVTTLGIKAPFIPSQNYQVMQAKVNIPYENFKILPTDHVFNPPLSISQKAYILGEGKTLKSPIDIDSGNFTVISSQKWVTFNQTAQTISVSTNNNTYALTQNGIYSIVIVQSLGNQFPQVNPFTQFYLIMAPRTIKLQPPFFQPALSNQVVSICPEEQTKMWKFVIPEPVDPNDSEITINVKLSSEKIFSYNNLTRTITQNQAQQSPSNQTIKINLIDDLNATADYQLKIEFVCKKVNKTTAASNFQPNLDISKQVVSPTAYIQKVDSSGLVHIKFNQKMQIPENLAEIENGTIQINETTYQNIQINVIPGRLSDKKNLDFTWKLVNYSASALKIQLNFQNLQYVSFYNRNPEQISVSIFRNNLFADTNANYMNQPTILNQVVLPQMASAGAMAAVEAIGQKAQGVANTMIFSNMIVAAVISGPLQQLLGSIRHLQIVIHAMLLNLGYPAISNVCFGIMMNILTFQFYSFNNFFNQILNLDPDGVGNSPFNAQFNQMGYGALYIIQNFGTLCITIFITPLLFIVVKTLYCFFTKKFKDLNTSVTRQMFYGNHIAFMNETFLFLGVCVALNTRYFSFETYGDTVNSFLTIIFGILILTFPIFVIVFYNLPKNYKKMLNNDEEFMARYGQVLEGLNFLRMGQKDTLYPFFSLIRKVILIFVVVYMQEKPVFSLFVLIYLSIIMITLVGYIPPFKSIVQNQLELANEVFALLTVYQLFTFTDFLSDPPTREFVGYSLVCTTLLCIVMNIGVVTAITVSLTAFKLKIKYYKWRYTNALEVRMKERRQKAIQRHMQLKRQKKLQEWQKNNEAREAELRLQMSQTEEARLQNQRMQQTAQQQILNRQTVQAQRFNRQASAFPAQKILNLHSDQPQSDQQTFQQLKQRFPEQVTAQTYQNLSQYEKAIYRIAEYEKKAKQKNIQKQTKPKPIQHFDITSKFEIDETPQFDAATNTVKLKTKGQIQQQQKQLDPAKVSKQIKVQQMITQQKSQVLQNFTQFEQQTLSTEQIHTVKELQKSTQNNPNFDKTQPDYQLDMTFDGQLMDPCILEQFKQPTQKPPVQKYNSMGVDSFIQSEIEKGNLQRELKAYAEKRSIAQAKMYWKKPEHVLYDDDTNFGEYDENMSWYEKGKLFYKIIEYKKLESCLQSMFK